MSKTIQTIVLTVVSLIIVWPVRAVYNGGQSASLAAQKIGEKTLLLKEEEAEIQLKRKVIRKVLTKYKSPMVDSTDAFIDACVKYDLDCYVLPSIAGLESFFGTHVYPDSNNAFGWGRGLIMFDSWDQGIDTVGKGLRTKYINKGLTTIEQIGVKYCENPTWADRVTNISGKFEAEEAKMRLFFSLNEVEL